MLPIFVIQQCLGTTWNFRIGDFTILFVCMVPLHARPCVLLAPSLTLASSFTSHLPLSPSSHSSIISFFFSPTLCILKWWYHCSIFDTEVYEFLNTHLVASHQHAQCTEQLRGPTFACASAQGPAVLESVVMLVMLSGRSPGRTFPRSPIIAMAEYRAVSVWLLFLGTMHQRFICVAEFVNS